MAVTVLTDASTAEDTRTLSWTIPTLTVGDVVVVEGETYDQPFTLGVPSGTGLSFTERVTLTGSGRPRAYIWTAVASSGGTNVVVTSTVSGASVHTGVLIQFPTADGYSLAATPNTASASFDGGNLPQVALTGAAGNTAVIVTGDWSGNTGSVAWLASGASDLDQQTTNLGSQYYARTTLTGASTTVGMSSPTATGGSLIVAMEVIATATGETHAPWLLRPPGRISPAGRRTPWTGSWGSSDTAAVAADDTATGADAATLTNATAASDTAAGADTSTLAASASGTDTATGADTSTLAAALAATDTGAGADTSSLTASPAGTDTGAGVDTSSVSVNITASDTATGVDTASVDTGATAIAGTDTGTGVDTASLVAAGSAAETAAGTDTGTVAVGATVADTATAVDSAVVTITITGTDTASATDLAALAVGVAASDLAAALEAGSVFDPGVVIAPAPPERTFVVLAESRVLTVAAQSRVTVVPAESRTTEVS